MSHHFAIFLTSRIVKAKLRERGKRIGPQWGREEVGCERRRTDERRLMTGGGRVRVVLLANPEDRHLLFLGDSSELVWVWAF